MAVNTTSTLSNSVRTQYIGQYIVGANASRLYDMFAAPVGKDLSMAEAMRGSSVQVNFLGDLAPATAAISQTQDISPVTFRDATASITPTSRGNAVQDSELLHIQAFTDYSQEAAQKFYKLGKNMIESVDLLAQAQATQGSNIARAAARASLDAGTAGHRLTDSTFAEAESRFLTGKVPQFMDENGMRRPGPGHIAVLHPFAYHDLRTSGNIDDVGVQQMPEIITDFTLRAVGNFLLVVSPWAKTFWSAGAANGSAVATTLSAAANNLATTITVASASNMVVGDPLMIGTIETANTHYPTNERVWIAAINSTTITIIGEADNGGLRFDHASGETVSNADSVYTVCFGGPMSLAKLYATNLLNDAGSETAVGEYGVVVGPKAQGLLNQFASVGWKYYGGYGRWNEAWMLRQEVSTSFEA